MFDPRPAKAGRLSFEFHKRTVRPAELQEQEAEQWGGSKDAKRKLSLALGQCSRKRPSINHPHPFSKLNPKQNQMRPGKFM